ncbi:MAG: DNA polymerase III subunit psi [Candidatus Erwinia impunctatus]|nr:DNA polymerase III subunit psi [Culicoides impunctatus]
MSVKRDQLLQQMGITRYQLRRPRALRGEVSIALDSETRLLIIAETLPPLSAPLMDDALRAMGITAQQVMELTPDQTPMLPETHSCVCWYLGEGEADPANPLTIVSPSFSSLNHNADAKRALWQQITHHERYFFTDWSASCSGTDAGKTCSPFPLERSDIACQSGSALS